MDALCATADLGLMNVMSPEKSKSSENSSNEQLIQTNQFEALFGRLTSRMMTGRSEILRNEFAREKLLGLVNVS